MSENSDNTGLHDAEAAFMRYEAIRPRLPATQFAAGPLWAHSLGDVADRWDGFVLDAFGVLNIGDTAIPGAVARLATLRAMGRKLCVFTNAASYPLEVALAKYHRLGFDFAADEVVSSRDVAAAQLERIAPGATWGAIAAPGDSFADIPADVIDLALRPEWDSVEGFLFLSTTAWTAGLARRLARALAERPRPLVVANPDLVAPREGGLSVEPGAYAHDLLDRLVFPVHFHGKPFGAGFLTATERTGLAPQRLAMVGDTLHTDILGGRAAGMGTVLVARHGLFAGRDVGSYIRRSGIAPDAVVETT